VVELWFYTPAVGGSIPSAPTNVIAGLQDAHNLAMLLADVAHGRVAPKALDRYERERRPVALILVNVTDRAFGVVGRRGPMAALFRNRVSGLRAKAEQ
jgi:2-polyprenyl-6-methoxyphenol hydroxylase-like FAD-dependent oxidoreductase